MLEVLIDEQGSPVAPFRVIRGSPLLIRAATEALRQWKYSPTLQSGRPIRVQTEVAVKFTLPERAHAASSVGRPSRGPDHTANASIESRSETGTDRTDATELRVDKSNKYEPQAKGFFLEHQHGALSKNRHGYLYIFEDKFLFESEESPKCNFEYFFKDMKKVKSTRFPKGYRIEPRKGRKYHFLTERGTELAALFKKP